MGRVRFTRSAREDLLDIWQFIARDSVAAADRVYDRIENGCGLLALDPELGKARPKIGLGARALVLGKWIALYRLVDGGVQVVRVMDGTRDLRKLEWDVEKG